MKLTDQSCLIQSSHQLLADYEDGVWPKYDTFDSRINSDQSEKHYEQLTV